MSLRSLIVDFNAYFASVEQQEQPRLRGKPVAVAAVMTDSTCCIAASYEAKHYGVKTGTSVRDARILCPDLHLIEARPKLYVEYHHRLVEVLESCMHVSKVLSIDEMVCDLIGRYCQRDEALRLAHQMKSRISERIGEHLRCSIGIAPNRYLAKTASDMQKPDGLVVIEKEELPQCLYALNLRDFCGIGRSMEERLRREGIRNVRQLCSSRRETLRKAWGGVQGDRMYERLRGEDIPDLPSQRKSLGHSHVLPPLKRTEKGALAVLHRLLQKAASRLRQMGLYAGGLALEVKRLRGEKWKDDTIFPETRDTLELLGSLEMLWKRQPRSLQPPLAVGVTLFQLIEAREYTPSLFDPTCRRDALNQAMDRLNKQWGRHAVYWGGAHEAMENAPTRIPFTSIPDFLGEDAEDEVEGPF